jgi:hypothetical protein
LAFTYVVAAYIILPRTVRIGLKILQRKHVPRYTVTGDGLPGNLVRDGANIGFVTRLRRLRIGSFRQDGGSPSGVARAERDQSSLRCERHTGSIASNRFAQAAGELIGVRGVLERKRPRIVQDQGSAATLPIP